MYANLLVFLQQGWFDLDCNYSSHRTEHQLLPASEIPTVYVDDDDDDGNGDDDDEERWSDEVESEVLIRILDNETMIRKKMTGWLLTLFFIEGGVVHRNCNFEEWWLLMIFINISWIILWLFVKVFMQVEVVRGDYLGD